MYMAPIFDFTQDRREQERAQAAIDWKEFQEDIASKCGNYSPSEASQNFEGPNPSPPIPHSRPVLQRCCAAGSHAIVLYRTFAKVHGVI